VSKLNSGLSYAKSGVDLKAVKRVHRELEAMLKRTHSTRIGGFGEVFLGAGHYAGLIDIGGGKTLAMHVDGVGTKTMIASALGRYDTVGIDCVAMNVNDLICLGAEPIALVDYLAINKPDETVIKSIIKGLVTGALEARVTIVGGETAVMPDLISGFDLAAMSIGRLDRGRAVTGDKIKIGDVILGLESSGIHSNGLTLARKALIPRLGLSKNIPELGATLGDELLTPTRIYVKPILDVLEKCDVHGLAHITGGAFTKLTRLNPNVGFNIDNPPKPNPIFQLIRRHGKIDLQEMYKTFNMGIGFCIIAPEDESHKVKEIVKKSGVACRQIGEIEKKIGVIVKDVKVI
jgi:phosphoribosylformylglycinamidine cyclo-ligase